MTGSEKSDSANEVEALISNHPVRRPSAHAGGTGGWGIPRGQQPGSKANVQRGKRKRNMKRI